MDSKLFNKMSSTFDNQINSLAEHKLIFTIVTVLVSLYTASVAPKLPPNISKFFDVWYVKLLFVFILAYISSHNPTLSLILAVFILWGIQLLISWNFNLPVDAEDTTIVDGVPLSPTRASFVKETLYKAKEHQQLATEAAASGHNDLANKHIEEFNKQTIKIDSAIKAKENLISAQIAQSNGDAEKAQLHLNEVNKNNMKLSALSNSEQLTQGAMQLLNSGNSDEANKLLHEAIREESKVNVILTADDHLEKLKEAVASNDKSSQEFHLEKIQELQDNLTTLCTSPNCINENSTHTPKETNVEKSRHNDNIVNQLHIDDDITGYDTGSYASY